MLTSAKRINTVALSVRAPQQQQHWLNQWCVFWAGLSVWPTNGGRGESLLIKVINFAVPFVDASGAEITHFTFKYSLNYNGLFLTLEFRHTNKTNMWVGNKQSFIHSEW